MRPPYPPAGLNDQQGGGLLSPAVAPGADHQPSRRRADDPASALVVWKARSMAVTVASPTRMLPWTATWSPVRPPNQGKTLRAAESRRDLHVDDADLAFCE